ncbi:hypothetical protein Tco_0577315, partial [Tanacetum coccineum]
MQSPSSSLTIPIQKTYLGTSELDEGIGSKEEGPGSKEEEAAPKGQQQEVPVVDAA